MLAEVMAALKAVPAIARALRDISDGIKDATASKRREEKDVALDTLLAAARTRRRVREEIERAAGDSPGKPPGVG